MSKVIINIPDCYPRVEGLVEIFGRDVDRCQLPYLNCCLDHDLLPGDVVEFTLSDPFGVVDFVGSFKTADGVVYPVINYK